MATRTRARGEPEAMSLTSILGIGLGALIVLGGLVWLALAYEHAGMIAILLPVLPILFSFLVEQCRNAMAEMREDGEGDQDEADEPRQTPKPQT